MQKYVRLYLFQFINYAVAIDTTVSAIATVRFASTTVVNVAASATADAATVTTTTTTAAATTTATTISATNIEARENLYFLL